MTPLELVLDALRGRGMDVADRPKGGNYQCQCPAHHDGTGMDCSLSVKEGDNGAVLLQCFAGCRAEEIVASLGLKMADLFPKKERAGRRKSGGDGVKKPTEKPVDTRKLPAVPEDVREFLSRKVKREPGPKLTPIYDYKKAAKSYKYVDEDGKRLIVSERFETTTFEAEGVDPESGDEVLYLGPWGSDEEPKRAKTFRQHRFAPNGWKMASLDGGYYELKGKVWLFTGVSDPDGIPSASCEWFDTARRVVYRLPEVRKAAEEGGRTCFIVEGEKDVESLVGLGFCATCNPMGAGKWVPEYNLSFDGFSTIVIWCDRDKPGYRHALQVRENLLPVVADVRIVEGLSGKDCTDHLDAGHRCEEFRSLSVDDVDARIAFIDSLPAPLPVTHKAEVGDSGEPPSAEKGSNGLSHASVGAFSTLKDFAHMAADVSEPRGSGGWLAPWFAPLTDAGNAERLIDKLDHTVKWSAEREQWLTWDSTRWLWDRTGGAPIRQHVIDMARRLRQENSKEEKLVSHSRSMESANGVNNCLSLLKSIPGVPIVTDDLDLNPTILPCENGEIDLKTGELHEARREHLMTRRINVAYRPDADCPQWIGLLKKAIPDVNYRQFLHRWLGYCLTGLTVEQKLLFIYGPPQTGKSTIVQTVTRILSEYYETIDRKKLMMTRMAESEIPAWLAKLKGARMVTAVECKDSDRLDSSMVKIMTGNEDITARYLHQNEVTYRPQFKLIITGNYRFQFEGDDSAIARRILEMTLDQRVAPEDVDPYLDEKLWAEREGIFAWMVEGARLYFKDGLCVPGDMPEKIKEYQKDMDFIGQFIQEKLEVIEGGQIGATDLFELYKDWAKDNNEWKMSMRTFSGKMRGRVESKRITTGVIYVGVRRRVEVVPM